MSTSEDRDATWLMALLACVLLMPSVGLNVPLGVKLMGQVGAAVLLLGALAGFGGSSRVPRHAWTAIALMVWFRLNGEALALLRDVQLPVGLAVPLTAGSAAASGIALLLAGRPGRGALALGTAGVASLCVGVLALRMPTTIDVYVYLRDGSTALLHGTDPYTLTFVSPYSAADNEIMFGSGVLDGSTILFGFPYPPVVLLLVTVSSLFGDPRVLFAVALVIAGLLVGRNADVRAGVVLMLLPGIGFVLIQGWVEPVSILLLAAAVATADRRPMLVAVALGLLMASKQYFIVALPLVWLLLPGERWRSQDSRRFLATAAIAGTSSLLPFLVWHPEALWRSLVEFHLRQPFRDDSISLAAWLVDCFGWPDPDWLGIGSLVIGLIVALALASWAPRTPASFCFSLALTLLVLFSLSKQAFSNYWFLVEAAVLMGGSLWRPSTVQQESLAHTDC